MDTITSGDSWRRLAIDSISNVYDNVRRLMEEIHVGDSHRRFAIDSNSNGRNNNILFHEYM